MCVFRHTSPLRSPFIEDFLKSATAQQPETTTMFDLLWKFYEKSGQYVAAAKILNKLADRHSTELRWSKGNNCARSTITFFCLAAWRGAYHTCLVR